MRQGLISDSKVLDIRQVDVSTGKILENDIPVFVITFATQEMLLFRNAKSGEIVVGAEDRVEQCHYAAVITRVQEELDNELTGGWKVVEVRAILFLIPSLNWLTFFCRRWRGDQPVHICRTACLHKSIVWTRESPPLHITLFTAAFTATYLQRVHLWIQLIPGLTGGDVLFGSRQLQAFFSFVKLRETELTQ